MKRNGEMGKRAVVWKQRVQASDGTTRPCDRLSGHVRWTHWFHRITLTAATTILGLSASWHGYAGATSGGNIPWREIDQIAREFVANESPPSVFPFRRASVAELARSPRKVFAHYFPFFVLSYENAPLDRDHWAQFLSREGEHGKWGHAGGFTRERPLAPAPWNSPYWRQINAAIDILRAQRIGIDGFGIDLTRMEPAEYPDQAHILCDAAAAIAPGFQIVPEPDGDILKQATPEQMVATINAIAACPTAYHLPDGRLLIVPFAPNNQPTAYWEDVLARLAAGGQKAALIPVLLGLAKNAERFAPISHGMSSWGQRDPVTIQSEAHIATQRAATALVSTWMHPVVPQDARPKDAIFWEAANTELFRTLWMQAIEGGVPYVHLITWNDYSESTEIAPSSGTQFLFYDLTAFFVDWLKTDRPPAIVQDALYYSHRTQVLDLQQQHRPDDTVFRNLGALPVRNNIELVALLTAPAIIEITIGGRSIRENAPAGLAVLRAPAESGRPTFRIIRNGRIVVGKTSDWEIEGVPDKATPTYYGGGSTRAFVQVPTPSGNWQQ
jgi:hypothetical protein